MLGWYAGVGAVAALLAYLLTPLARWLSVRQGWVDHPSERKVHERAVATLGGLALYGGVVAGLVVAYWTGAFPEQFKSSQPLGVAVGVTLLVALGVLDDIVRLSAPLKLAGQILAAGTMTLMGVQVLFFWLPGIGVVAPSPDLGVPLTVLVVLVVVNAVNLVDGLDGLAAGIVAIAAAAYFVYSYQTGSSGVIADASPAPLLSAVTVGACLGFLPHNVHPAKIFMGDSGSMLLGGLLAGATVTGIGRSTVTGAPDTLAAIAPIVIPLLVLAVPFVDTTLAIGRRIRAGKGIMTADKAHLHHRLLDYGYGHGQAVSVLWASAALLAGGAVAVAILGPVLRVGLGVLLALLVLGVAVVVTRPSSERRARGAAVKEACLRSTSESGSAVRQASTPTPAASTEPLPPPGSGAVAPPTPAPHTPGAAPTSSPARFARDAEVP